MTAQADLSRFTAVDEETDPTAFIVFVDVAKTQPEIVAANGE